jgi:hypothetical protein
VRYSLKTSAREIGWHAYATGGKPFMVRIAARLQELRPDTTFHVSILDKWWDDIGDDERGVWRPRESETTRIMVRRGIIKKPPRLKLVIND